MSTTAKERQQKYAGKMRAEGKRKYSFWLNENESSIVKAMIGNSDSSNEVEKRLGAFIDETRLQLKKTTNVDLPAEAIVRIALMYLKESVSNGAKEYPSLTEYMEAAKDDEHFEVISSKGIGDVG